MRISSLTCLGGEDLHRERFDLVLAELLEDVRRHFGTEGDQQDRRLLLASHRYFAFPSLSSFIQVRIRLAIIAGSFFAMRTSSFSMRCLLWVDLGLREGGELLLGGQRLAVGCLVGVTSLISGFSGFGRPRRRTSQIIPTTSSGPSTIATIRARESIVSRWRACSAMSAGLAVPVGAERQAGQGDEVAAVGVEAGGGRHQLADRVGLGRIGDHLAVERDGDVQPLDGARGADGLLDGLGQLVVGGDVALLVLGGAARPLAAAG